MKTIKLLFILIVTSVITGCTVTKEKEFAPVDESGYTLVETDFKALLFSEEDMVWPEGAAIGVYGTEMGYNEPYTIKKAGVGRGEASFYGPLVKGDVAAYYPYSPSFIGDANAMPFTLESEQTYNENPTELYLMHSPTAFAHLRQGRMEFYYPNGLLCLNLGFADAVKVKSLRIESELSGISGLGVIKSDGSINMTESSKPYVTLDCGEGVLTKAEDGTLTPFYLVLMPGVYDDLKVTVHIDGVEAPFTCGIPEIAIEKVDADDARMTTVSVIPAEGPDGFVEEDVEFDEE